VAVSGGVISFSDPLYVNEFFEEMIRAAVRAAEDFGTYVMVHCHNSEAAQRALRAGVKSFDHLSCVDEETMKMLADAGAVASVQLLVAANVAKDYPEGDPRQVKGVQCITSARNALGYAKKHGVTLGWGTDLLDSTGRS
jgi:imidazolonepropionase-like amidohydrolase